MTYKELQAALKAYREAGEQLSCRLNECKETLEAELKRLEELNMRPEDRTARALLDVGIDVLDAVDVTWTITIRLVALAWYGWIKAGVATVQAGRKARAWYEKHEVEEKVERAIDDTVDCVYALFYVSRFTVVTVSDCSLSIAKACSSSHYRGCEWLASKAERLVK